MRKREFKLIISLLAIGLALLLGYAREVYRVGPEKSYARGVTVRRVIDGDTIELADGKRVRYIGINTPETKHPRKAVEYMGKEASDFNRELVEGKVVRLEFDAQKIDKYGRLLAYVYVDELFVNAELVKCGFAQICTVPPNVRYASLFLKLEREARAAKRGLWAKKVTRRNF